MTFRAPIAVAALLLAGIVPAVAAPESPSAPSTSSPLARFQSRLEADAARILSPEVSGTTKSAVAASGGELWTALTVAEWEARLLRVAPTLDKAARVVVRRTEVIWAEERVVDAYASPVFQMASVHAIQRGLASVLKQLGVAMPQPVTRSAAPKTPSSGIKAQIRPEPIPMPAPTPAARTAPRTAPAPVASRDPVVRSPREIAAYRTALEAEAFRILTPEFGGQGVVVAMTERRANLRRSSSVAGLRATLAAGAPSLTAAGAVLERRAEVLHAQYGILDAYDSPAVKKAAVEGLVSGLERVLKQFGR